MTTLGIVVLLLVLVVLMYFMMTRKGGGYCGSGDPGVGGGSCSPDEAPKASHRHSDQVASEEPSVDPVCGMTVGADSNLTAEHKGRLYRFCSEHCRKNFLDNPDKYL